MSETQARRGALVYRGGWWERPAGSMTFNAEPTAAGDDEVAYLREWYEANRPRGLCWWLDYCARSRDGADDFMLAMLGYVRAIEQARAQQRGAAAIHADAGIGVSEASRSVAAEKLYDFVAALGVYGDNPIPWANRTGGHKREWLGAVDCVLEVAARALTPDPSTKAETPGAS